MKKAKSDLFLMFDSGYRGQCNMEDTDQMAFTAWWQYLMPWLNIFHVPNETRSNVQHGVKRQRMGVNGGVSDNVILTPGYAYPFGVIEAKRRDSTKSAWRAGQQPFMNTVIKDGGFAACGYGLEGLKSALRIYLLGVDDDAILLQYIAQHKAHKNDI